MGRISTEFNAVLSQAYAIFYIKPHAILNVFYVQIKLSFDIHRCKL